MEIVADSLELEVEASASKAKDSLEDMLSLLKRIRSEVSQAVQEFKAMPNAFSGAATIARSGGSTKGGKSRSGYAALKKEVSAALDEASIVIQSETEQVASVMKSLANEMSNIKRDVQQAQLDYSRYMNSHMPRSNPYSYGNSSNMGGQAAAIKRDVQQAQSDYSRYMNSHMERNDPYSYGDSSNYGGRAAAMIPNAKDKLSWFDRLKEKLRESKEEFKSAHAGASSFFSSIKRIAMYRAIRAVLRAITEGIKTGVNNLYQYSKAFDGHFSKAMDKAASSLLSFKNSVGAAVAPLIQHFAPAIDWISDKLISLNNWISKVGAALRGETSYTIAKRYATEYAEAAEDAAKATKDFSLGFDELNVINPNAGSDKVGTDYKEMFEEATMTSGEMVKLKETFESIFAVVKSIGAGILAWKLSKSLMDGIDALIWLFGGDGAKLTSKNTKKGLGLTIAGLAASGFSGYDMGKNGVDFANLITDILSAAATIAGVSLFTGSVAAGFLVGIPLAIVATAIGFKLGEKARIQELYEKSEVYAKIQEWKAKAEQTDKISKQIEVDIQARISKYDEITDTFDAYKQIINDAFDLSDVIDKTPLQIDTLKGLIETINGWGLDGLKLEFDEATGKIKQTRDEILNVIEALEKKAKTEALKDFMVDAYKNQFEAARNLTSAVKDRQDIEKEIMNAEVSLYEWKQKKERYDALNADFYATRGGQSWAKETAQEYRELKQWFQESADTGALLERQLEGLREQYKYQIEVVDRASEAYADAKKNVEWIRDEKEKLIGVEESLGDSFEKTAAKAEGSAARIKQSYKDALEESISLAANASVLDLALGDARGFAQSVLTKGNSVRMYANGGFPAQGDLFIANEQAPELVGRIGARPAVANNDQIVQAVSQGVYSAVSKAMSGANRSDNGDISVSVYIDGKQVNAAVKKAEHERGAKIATAGLVY